MKRRWLIAIASLAMAITFVFGVTACKDSKSDEEIAQTAINMLDSLYLKDGEVKNYETPDNFNVLGQVNVDGTVYPVKWTPTAKTENVNIAECVTIGEVDSKGQVTVGITRKTVDVEYTLTASVTAGKAEKSTQYTHKIPKKSSEDAVTATLSFATADARVSQTTTQQVWKQNGITFTNDKASSSNDIIDSKNPVRLYKGSKVTIEFPGIRKIDFHSADDQYKYYTNLKGNLAAAFSESELSFDDENFVASLTLANPSDKVEFTCSAGQARLFSIDVEGKEGGLSDAEKLAAAKDTLKLAQTNYFMVDNVTLPATHSDATVTWELKDASENVAVESGVLKVKSLPAAETEVTLVAHLKLNEETADKEVKIKLLPTPTLTGEGTEAKPYSASEANAIAKLVDADGFFSLAGAAKAVYIHGYVIDLVGDDKGVVWNSDYNNWTNVYIADSKTATKDDANSLLVYRIVADGTILAKEENALKVGAEITLVGYLQNYRGNTPEVAAYGSNNVTATKYTYVDNRTPAEKVADALKAVSATMTVSATGETPLPATTEPDVTFTWALKQGETLPEGTTFASNKLTVTKLPATDTTVKFVVTATCGTETLTNNTKEVAVTIKAEGSQPQPSGDLALTGEKMKTALEGKSGYQTGTFTIDGVSVEIKDVMASTDLYDSSKTDDNKYTETGMTFIQFKKDTGSLKVKGTFTQITVVMLTNYAYADANKLPIKVGTTTLTEASHTEASANFQIAGKDYYLYTIVYNVTTPGEQTIEFGGVSNAMYIPSITLKGTASQGGTEPPAEEGVLYTLSTATAGQNTNYAGNEDVEVDGVTWNIEGNAAMNPWRFGGKNLSAQDRKLTGKTAINGTVKQVVITFGTANLTVNKVTFNVFSSDPTAEGATAVFTKEVTFSAAEAVTVDAPDTGWTNCFYQLVFNVTNDTKDNKYVTVSTIVFRSEGSGSVAPQPTHDGTAENPFTPSEAVAYGKQNLATNGATTTTEVYVKGYVIDVGSWKGTYWQYVYIADDLNAKTSQLDVVIEVYKLYPDSTNLILSGDLIKGREITVHGYLKNFTSGSGDKAKTTYEFDDYKKDNDTVHPVASFASALTRDEKLALAKTAVGDLASDDVIAGFNLPAVTISGVSYAWTVTPTTYAQIVTEQNVSKLQITRPENGTGNQKVTLSLTITCDGTAEQTPLTWELTIKQKPSTTVESELYILPAAHQTSGSNNSYTGNCDVTYNGVTWNIEGNSQSSPWRFGGKSLTNPTDRKLTGKTAIQGKVSKVLLTLTDGGGITVNSVTLNVYKTDPTAAGATATYTKSVTTYTKDQTITFEAGADEDWTNCYFEIVFNVTVTGSSNKYVAISNLEFKGTAVAE